jgi:predicted glutamine amidotransferase
VCRYLSYLGDPIRFGDLVYKPENSLIHQAAEAMESRTRINADGFGVGWYNPAVHPEPAVFKDISPAWNNANLRSLSDKVSAPCILAHVRAARRFDPVSRANCHPFHYGRLLWMHNGDIPGRGRLHRRVCRQIDDDLAARIVGNTDSELAFILFLSFLGDRDSLIPFADLVATMTQTIEQLAAWWRSDEDSDPIVMNFCVSNGSAIVASRFALGEPEVPTLHYCAGSRYSCEGGVCRMRTEPGLSRSVIVSSEKISEDPQWVEVDNGTLVTVDENLAINVQRLAVGVQ